MINKETCFSCGGEFDGTEGLFVRVDLGTAQSWASPGDPPGYDWMCDSCLDSEYEREATERGWLDYELPD